MRRNLYQAKKYIHERESIKIKMFEFILFLGAVSILGLTISNLVKLRQDQKAELVEFSTIRPQRRVGQAPFTSQIKNALNFVRFITKLGRGINRNCQ